jgi:hypothetical protein
MVGLAVNGFQLLVFCSGIKKILCIFLMGYVNQRELTGAAFGIIL